MSENFFIEIMVNKKHMNTRGLKGACLWYRKYSGRAISSVYPHVDN